MKAKCKNKLQQKIYAMFQRTIQFSLHIFSTLCVSLRDSDTTEKDLCEKEKYCKFLKIKFKYMFKKLKRVLGFQDFLDYDTLKETLRDETKEDFSTAEFQIILYEDDLKIWIISNLEKNWFILDNGKKYKARSVLKADFKYKIEDFKENSDYANLYVDYIEFPIVINKSFSGSTETFTHKIESFKTKK